MKMNHFNRLGLFALSVCMFVSCVDEKYDLDDVDLTIGTTGDLTLPTSSTGEIALKNIMDLQEDGVVQIINGEYYIVEDGKADVPKINIDNISIPSPSLSQFVTEINVDDIAPARATAGSTEMITISVYGNEIQIPNQTYRYTILPKDNALYEIGVTSNTVPSEVVELTSVKFVDETTLDAKIKINLDKEHSFINKVHLDDLKVTLPKGLHVSHAEFRHWTDIDDQPGEFEEDGKHEHRDEKVKPENINNEEGWILLTEQDVNTIIGKIKDENGNDTDRDHEIDVLITLDQALTGNEGFTFKAGENGQNGSVGLEGLFKIDGTFRLEAKDFELNENTISKDLVTKLIQTQSFDVIRPEKIKFEGSASFAGDIQVKSVSGQVKSDIGDIAPIALNNMPDFLNDPEVRLDLANPAIFVEVNNPLPAQASTTITLKSIYDNGTPVVKVADIEIKSGHKVYCLAEDPASASVPAEYADLDVVPVQIAGLGDLLEILPKEINVELADVVMDIKDITIPEEYELSLSYKVYTPLEFGENFKLVYQGTEEGLSADLSDINKVNTKGISIKATAVTNLPLNLRLSLDAMDSNNVSLKDIFYVNELVVPAHKGDKDATSKHPIELTLKAKDGHSISDLLSRLDKIQYRAVADADSKGKLTENAMIKLENITITLLGGISYDAN